LEILVSFRSTLLTVAIRREILSVLATSASMTVPTATARVAAGWSARRRRRGESPSSVQSAQAIVFQVGADLVDEVAAQQAVHRSAPTSSPRPLSGCGQRSPGVPAVLARRRWGPDAGGDLPDDSAAVVSFEEGSMSEHVTWEICPRCRLLAAVGWATVGGTDGAPHQLCPVEFDCPTGCRPGLDERVRAYLPAGHTPPDSAAERRQ
jgi:hypothetical protein